MIVERLGVLEAQEAFEARRRHVTRGDALGLPFIIEHVYDKDDDAYWDGAYSLFSDTLFHVKIKCNSYESAFSWHNQHMDVISPEHAAILTDLNAVESTFDPGPTAAEAGFPNSPHRYLSDHIIELHLRKAINNDFMTLRMASIHDEYVRLLVKYKTLANGGTIYVDDILRPLCDALRRPEVFGQSFIVQKATIAEAPSGRYEIINAIHMGISISDSGKTKLLKSIDLCNVGYDKWDVVRKMFGKHVPYDFGSYSLNLNNAEDTLLDSFMDKMEKLALTDKKERLARLG